MEYLYCKRNLYALILCSFLLFHDSMKEKTECYAGLRLNQFLSIQLNYYKIVFRKREETLLIILVLTKTNENMNSLTIHIKR